MTTKFKIKCEAGERYENRQKKHYYRAYKVRVGGFSVGLHSGVVHILQRRLKQAGFDLKVYHSTYSYNNISEIVVEGKVMTDKPSKILNEETAIGLSQVAAPVVTLELERAIEEANQAEYDNKVREEAGRLVVQLSDSIEKEAMDKMKWHKKLSVLIAQAQSEAHRIYHEMIAPKEKSKLVKQAVEAGWLEESAKLALEHVMEDVHFGGGGLCMKGSRRLSVEQLATYREKVKNEKVSGDKLG